MSKNVKRWEMEAIVQKSQRRKLLEPEKNDLAFKIRGIPVPPPKIYRWMKENGVPVDSLNHSQNEAAGKSLADVSYGCLLTWQSYAV